MAAQRAIIMTPEFNTLGDPQPAGRRNISQDTDKPANNSVQYKAMVLLYFGGGADSWSMLVPSSNCTRLYDEYNRTRGAVALRPEQIQDIDTVGQPCQKLGIHGSMPFLKELYDGGNAAFVSNIGALVEPLTKETFRNRQRQRCGGLFSHSDQTQAAFTLNCQMDGSNGAGGRIGDQLASKLNTRAFSLAGRSTFLQGAVTNPTELSGNIGDALSGGLLQFKEYIHMKSAVENITLQHYKNVYSEEYARQLGAVIRTSERLREKLGRATVVTDYQTPSGLDRQLREVARVISTKDLRQAERDFFYVRIGGWDTHRVGDMGPSFATVDNAMRRFVSELRAQNAFDSVVLVTQSEFGRTMTPNGNPGTDHGWAGNHFVLGGKVNGGRVHNKFPESLLTGSEQSVDRRGRMIPKYPWESMMLPIAEWMGVTEFQRKAAFPNLGNFKMERDIIRRDAMFSN